MRTVLFVVTHLMGSGHLVRTLALARAVVAAGGQAVVVSGGRPLDLPVPDGVEMRALPPVWVAGLDYSRLIGPEGPADAAHMIARAQALSAALAEVRPEVVVTETWPFGRGTLRAEYRALAEAATAAGARLVASIRDIPEPPSTVKKAARAEAALAGFDAVLVHGDATLMPFEAAWPLPGAARGLLRYTGYVADPLPPPATEGAGEVLVAVGQGAIGRRLLEVAAGAARLSDRPWRLRVGGADAGALAARLSALGPALAEPAAPDYRARLRVAAASVSLAGYNTVCDLVAAGTPALLVPMAEGGEAEQRLRAEALAARGARVVPAEALTPAALAEAVEAAIRDGARLPTLRLDGATRAAEILLTL
ncbi:MAG: glycosyltransferase [Pseudomonadota bacterium]